MSDIRSQQGRSGKGDGDGARFNISGYIKGITVGMDGYDFIM